MRRMSYGVIVLLTVLAIVFAGCAPAATPTAAPAGETPAAGAGSEGQGSGQAASAIKLAAIFPGVITDADYNTLAYVGLTAVKTDLGVETAYSESVPVPDVDRVMREYIDAKYNMIWTHGGQFVNQTVELARQFPDITFIAEGDAPVENPPANLWFIDRNFHVGFYGVGTVAGLSTKTGKIGYIGGQTLPFSYAEVHAIEQALKEQGLENVELRAVWAGDFNDPTKARQVADALMAEDVDVIMGSLNLGMFGVFEAVKASGKDVLVTAKYSDKASYAPDNYITALLYDFTKPMKDIVTRTQAGEKGGYYPLGFDTGVSLQTPLKNVPAEVQTKVDAVIADLVSGKITVTKDTTAIE